MYRDIDVSLEEEEKIIRAIAERIHQYGMEAPGILLFEGIKPLAYVGSQISRLMISPFLPLFGDELGVTGEKILIVLEKRENMEKLVILLEKLARGEKDENKVQEK